MDLIANYPQTPYYWCLEHNVRPYNPELWGDTMGDTFHTTKVSEETFLKRLAEVKHKKNSTPRKMDEFLELRMYGLVIYQLTGIQTGIQFQHAVTDYQRFLHSNFDDSRYNLRRLDLGNRYGRWADKWKTSIILNGGTTNDSLDYVGTMQQHLQSLEDNGILVKGFREPDLGNCLTAMCFLVDERVFNSKLYPSFEPTPKPWGTDYTPNENSLAAWLGENENNYGKWVEKIGGEGNAFLREFLNGKKLAT